MPSFALQEVRGEIGADGVWRPVSEHFSVYLPYNDKGLTVRRELSPELAVNVDWNLVRPLVLEKWKNNEINGGQIESMDILDFLSLLGVVNKMGQGYEIAAAYRKIYEAQPQTFIIDITDTANPREEK